MKSKIVIISILLFIITLTVGVRFSWVTVDEIGRYTVIGVLSVLFFRIILPAFNNSKISKIIDENDNGVIDGKETITKDDLKKIQLKKPPISMEGGIETAVVSQVFSMASKDKQNKEKKGN